MNIYFAQQKPLFLPAIAAAELSNKA